MRSEFSAGSMRDMRHTLGTDPREEDEFEYDEDEESGIEEDMDEVYEYGGGLSQFGDEVVLEENQPEYTYDTSKDVSGAMEQPQLGMNADSAYSTMTKVCVLSHQHLLASRYQAFSSARGCLL